MFPSIFAFATEKTKKKDLSSDSKNKIQIFPPFCLHMTILTSFCQYVDDQNNRYECCQTHNDNNEPAPDWKKKENMKVYFKINAI